MLPFPIISQLTIQPSINIIQDVKAHNSTSFVLTTSGNLYCNGLNSDGQLGLGDTTNRTDNWYLTNTSVSTMWVGSTNVTLVKKNDNSYWRTGRAYPFNGANTVSNAWTNVTSLFTAAETSAGSTITQIILTNENVVLLMADGTVWGSGRNLYGALGTGNTNNLTVFTNLGLTGITKIACVDYNIYALNANTGTVYGAGANTYSQLNTTASSTITTFRTVTTGATNIWCGLGTTLYVLKSDGLYACGLTTAGEFGNGTINSTPNLLIRVSTSLFPSNMYLPRGPVGGGMNMKLPTGEVYVAGTNGYSSGLGTTASISTWTHVPDKDGSITIDTGGSNRSMLIKSSTLYGCGTYNSTYPYLMPKFTSNVMTVSILDITGMS